MSYRGYWTRELLKIIKDESKQFVSIKDLSEMTMIKTEDIISTLQHLGLLAYTKGAYVICASPSSSINTSKPRAAAACRAIRTPSCGRRTIPNARETCNA